MKEQRKSARRLSSTPHFLNTVSIHVLAVKIKFKIGYFVFFMSIILSGRKSQDQPAQILMLIYAAKG